MGQYYYAVIEINEQKVVYDRKVDGEYTPAKLSGILGGVIRLSVR